MSFDSVYDAFIDTLSDMDASAEDVAHSVSEYFYRAMLQNRIGEAYRGRLTEWYNDWASAMEAGTLPQMQASLTARYQDLVTQAREEAAALQQALGYDPDYVPTAEREDAAAPSQRASAGAYTAMSQEQGTKLEGLFTSVAMHAAAIDERLERVADRLADSSGTLERIERHTADTADTLAAVADDIRRIVREGIKTR